MGLVVSILRWDKPRKAEREPLGVYVPNMSDADARTFRARKVGGKDPRIEIRVKMGSQIVIVVRPDQIRISMNGPAVLGTDDWMDIVQATWEAKDILWKDQKEKKEKQNA